jgi:hypothetical protein
VIRAWIWNRGDPDELYTILHVLLQKNRFSFHVSQEVFAGVKMDGSTVGATTMRLLFISALPHLATGMGGGGDRCNEAADPCPLDGAGATYNESVSAAGVRRVVAEHYYKIGATLMDVSVKDSGITRQHNHFNGEI